MSSLVEFATTFFTTLGAEVTKVGTSLQVRNVPSAFQKFYGKNEPYTIVFSEEEAREGVEVMGKGSYLLKAMNDYLQSRGETTLFKIMVEDNPHATFAKSFVLHEGRVHHITSTREYVQFVRFTFQTTFKYLNEKEVVTTEVYRDSNGSVVFNPEQFTLEEGKKREISTDGVKELYPVAKEDVRERLKEKTAEVSVHLGKDLQKEVARVRAHYDSQVKEIDEELGKHLAQLRELEGTQKDVKNKEQRIERLREQIQEYQKSNKREQLVKEADFFEQAEVKKHGLSIDTKLLNTTLFYYPVFTYGVFLRQGAIERLVTVRYNPVHKTMSALPCDACGKALTTITLDSGSHVICPACQKPCEECAKPSCTTCLKHTCATSGKKICGMCAARCQKCGKTRAKRYMHEHPRTGIKRCIACWKSCPSCGSLVDEAEMRGGVCQGCERKKVGESVRKNVFGREW